jgi:Na+/melibiose symporter-like transporter
MHRSGPKTAAQVIALILLLGTAWPAQAYVGPGAGLTAVGAFLAMIAAVLVSLVAFVWLPIRRRLRGEAAAEDHGSNDD